jgi:N-glycosylase/DNA lyase
VPTVTATECTLSVTIDPGDGPLSFDWGRPELLGTCAYWMDQTDQYSQRRPSHRLGHDLLEEIVACMLGGFGMPAEVGVAAFERLRRRGLIRVAPAPSEADLLSALLEPLLLPTGRIVRYRYPAQRATRLHSALTALAGVELPSEPCQLRDELLLLPGIGPKTASWIVRNQTGSGEVAIIDIHVHRAGIAAGFFRPTWRPAKHYALFERAFLEIAAIGEVDAAMLDGCIWAQLHQLGPASRLLIGDKPLQLAQSR